MQAQTFIETNFSEKITVAELAERFAIGRRTFERHFKTATSNSPLEYLQRVRVEAAKEHFESGRKTINEVMYEVGYSDTNAFRDVFKKIADVSPMDYRARYGREA